MSTNLVHMFGPALCAMVSIKIFCHWGGALSKERFFVIFNNQNKIYHVRYTYRYLPERNLRNREKYNHLSTGHGTQLQL